MKKKRSKALLISGIIALIYSFLLVRFFLYYSLAGIVSNVEVEKGVAFLGAILVFPHMILFGLATIFNWIGYMKNKRGFAMTSGILYLISVVIFPINVLFVIPSLVLSFIGYFNLKKINTFNKENFYV